MPDFMSLLQGQPRTLGDVVSDVGSATAGALAGGPQVGGVLSRNRQVRSQERQQSLNNTLQIAQFIQQEAQAEAAKGNQLASTMLEGLAPFNKSPLYADLVAQVAVELEPLEDTISPTEVIGRIGQIAKRVGAVPGSGAKITERDKKVQDLVGRGIDKDRAIDIVDKNIIVGVDQQGIVSFANKVDRTVEFVDPALADQVRDVASPGEPAIPSPEKEDTVFGSLSSLGLVPVGKEVASRTVGQFIEGMDFPEVTRARATIRSIRDQIIAAYSTTNRPPVIQQERILQNFPSLGPAENPARAFELMSVTHGQLKKQEEADLKISRDPTIDPIVRREHQRRALAIRDVIVQIGDPSEFNIDDLPKASFSDLYGLIPTTETGEDLSGMSDDDIRKALGID